MRSSRLFVLILLGLVFAAIPLAEQEPLDTQSQLANLSLEASQRGSHRGSGALVIPYHVNYQGYLEDDAGNPVTDTLGMDFRIFTSSAGGTELWSEVHSLSVENGIFNVVLGSVSPIPPSVFTTGEPRWLELGVETQTLSPRTEITSVGYSYRSFSSDTADYASDCNRVDNFDASASPTANDLFPLSFADGQYVNEGQADAITTGMILDGTIARADAEPTFKAPYADTADYALDAPATPDNDWAIAGSVLHPSGDFGLLMRGGNAHYGTEDSTHVNLGTACTTGTAGQNYGHCTVGGGSFNSASGLRSLVSGGFINRASGSYSTAGGGESNTASGGRATVAGGSQNVASVAYATVCGGESNTASGSRGIVGGGYDNTAGGNYSFVGGGQSNGANGAYSTVCGGYVDSAGAYYGGVFAGCSNLAGDAVSDTAAVVAGGWGNRATGKYSFIGGGLDNTASGEYSTVAGGDGNTVGFTGCAVVGGQSNSASGYMSAICGGASNMNNGDYAFATGRDVTVSSSADYTLAFGRSFTTMTPNAVIFHNSIDSIRVGIGNVSPTHLLDVGETGAYCNGAVWMDGSSRAYKENIVQLDTNEALNAVAALAPVKYNYKNDRSEEFVGFIAEEVPYLVASRDRRSLSPMDIVAVLTKVVQHQQGEIELLKEEIRDLKESME